jgi:hypothetical protein
MIPKNININYSAEVSSFTSSTFPSRGFSLLSEFTSSFLVSLTFFSVVFLPSLSTFSFQLSTSLGASCKAFKDKPILFSFASKLIILALISSQTLIKSLISLTTQ